LLCFFKWPFATTDEPETASRRKKVHAMTITGIGGGSQRYGSQAVGATSWQTRMQQTLGPVAQLFGETPQQLMSDLQSGKTSLSALAQSKGISQTDLLNAIQQGLQQSSANGGPQLSDTQITNLATTIANRVHGGHHHHRGGTVGAPGAAASGVDADGDNDGSTAGASGAPGSAALKLDVERLISDLQAAQSNASPGTASTGSGATDLLKQLTQFDQTL
jgi:hypothetical protein